MSVNKDVSACLTNGAKYIGDPLFKQGTQNNTYGVTKSALACQRICQETRECGGFNWDDEGMCWLKKSRGTRADAPGGVSGPRSCGEGKNYITPTLLTLSFQHALNMK